MKKLAGVLFLFSFLLQSQSNELYFEYAVKARNAIFTTLEKCGLNIVNVDDQYLQAPASKLIYGSQGRLLARYTYRNIGGANEWDWKNPNGSLSHVIRQGTTRMNFVTPFAGSIARVNRFTTAGGRGHYFLCQSQYVNFQVWDQCVQNLFVNVVTSQLCRFGDGGLSQNSDAPGFEKPKNDKSPKSEK